MIKQFKSILFAFSILLIGNNLVAQEVSADEVPVAVRKSFDKDFVNVYDLEWEHKSDREYRKIQQEHYNVEFEFENGKDGEAWYSVDGKLLKSKIEISKKELPTAVINSVKKNYNGYRIDEAEKIFKKGKNIYKLELENRRRDIDVLFSENGKIINKNKH